MPFTEQTPKQRIVDCLRYYRMEYHIDGFRFDLVGLIDTITINEIMEEVNNTGLTKQFYEYMYHQLNIDRMTLVQYCMKKDMENLNK